MKTKSPKQVKSAAENLDLSYGAKPQQHNALFNSALGGVVGLGVGLAVGGLTYDILNMIDPAIGQSAISISVKSLSAIWKLAGQIIHHEFPSFEWQYFPLTGATIGTIVGGIAGLELGRTKGERHIYGPRLVASNKIPRMPRDETPGIRVGPITLSRSQETEGILTVAKPKGGKTVLMTQILEQLVVRGDRIIIVDFKGDYRMRFPGATFIAPWNSKSFRYQLGNDVRTRSGAVAFAEALIPMSDDPLWATAARGVLEGIIISLQEEFGNKWGWALLAERLKLTGSEPGILLAAIIKHRPLIAGQLKGMADETRSSIYLNLAAFGESIGDLAEDEKRLGKKWWSVADWLSGKTPVVIIGWSASQEALSKRVVLPVLQMAIQGLLDDSFPERSPEEPGFWFVIDEAGQLGEIPSFVAAWTAIRSKGGRMVAGFQTFGQISEVYGPASRAITGCDTRIIGKLNDADDQEDASRMAGMRLVEQLAVSATTDGGRTESWSAVEEAVYRKERFSCLGKVAGGVKMAYIGRNVVSEIIVPFPANIKRQ